MKNLTQTNSKITNKLYEQLTDILEHLMQNKKCEVLAHVHANKERIQVIKRNDFKTYFFLDKKLYQVNEPKGTIREITGPSSIGKNYFGYLLITLISKSIGAMSADLSKSDIGFNLTARIRLLNEINETIIENRLYDAFGLQYQESANLINYLFMFVDSEPGFIDLTFNGSAQFHIRVQKHNEITFTINSISQVIL